MGYYHKNKATIERVYTPTRKILVKVFNDELDRWEEAEFQFDALDAAIRHISDKLRELSM